MRTIGLCILSALAVLATLWLAAPAASQSFDCARAAHPLEKVICGNPRIAALDSEVARVYRDKLALLFDKQAWRGQQRDWQALLRRRCARGCDAAMVESEYAAQRDSLKSTDAETYEASYKTADVATLTLTHLDAKQFDFAIARDLEGEPLCGAPAGDGEAGMIATLSSPTHASWSAGKCAIDFALSRDASDHVTAIDVTASPGCAHYCKPGRSLSDQYLPANNWVPGNQ